MIGIQRGKYLGKCLGDPPKDEVEHFIRCPSCGGWLDCRDLGKVFQHEGPLHTERRINRNDGRSARNSNRWQRPAAAPQRAPSSTFCSPRSYLDRKDYAMEASPVLQAL